LFYASQTEESKRREEELAPGGTLVQMGKQLGAALGRDLSGMAAAALVGKGFRPLLAGLTVGAVAFVLADEGAAIAQLTDYPLESHLRGVVGHGAFGLAAGTLLSLTDGR
jgi:hypothetical protein